MEKNTETTTIPVIMSKLDDALKSLNKFKRRVNKRHNQDVFSISYDRSKSYIKKVLDETTASYIKLEVVDVTVSVIIPEVKYKGYTYIGTLKKSNVSNEVYPALKYENEDFSDYFNADFHCDHCHTNRNRKQVHLFRNEEGKELMIANSCSQDYFGIDIESKIESILWYRAKIANQFGNFGVFNDNYFDAKDFTKIVFGLLYRDGGYKKSDFYDGFGEIGTTETAKLYTEDSINGFNRSIERKEYESTLKVRNELIAIANKNGFDWDKYIEYWENFDVKGNTFLNNTRSAVFSDEPKYGLRAWSVWHIIKEEWDKRDKENAKNLVNEHIGSIGDKIETTVTVEKTKTINGYYGDSVIVNCIDDKGRTIVFFDNKCREYEIGQTLNIKAKIKAHDEYKGRKQTTIYYVKY